MYSPTDFAAIKTIASDLDRAAERAELIDRRPATGKQTWFLATLLFERGMDAEDAECGITNSQAVLTAKVASGWIDWLKSEPVRPAAVDTSDDGEMTYPVEF